MRRTAKRSAICTVLAALCAALLLSASASAVTLPTQKTCAEVGGDNSECFNGADTPAGSIQPTWLGVDEATGDVYVLDSANDAVDRFSKSGRYLGQLTGASTPAHSFGFSGVFTSPAQQVYGDDIAVDNSGGPTQGYIYVLGLQTENSAGTGGPGRLTAFDAEGNLRWQIPSENSFDHMCGVGVEPNGQLWTADTALGAQQRSVEDGSKVGSAVSVAEAPCDLAFDGNGVAYVYSIFGLAWQASPSISGSATPFEAATKDLATDTTTDLAYLDEGSQFKIFDSSLSNVGPGGEGFGAGCPAACSSTYNGLTVDGAHGAIFASDETFATDGGNPVQVWASNSAATAAPKPYVRSEAASAITATTATLNGKVNSPLEAFTTCGFQYVSDAQFQVDGFASATSASCASTPPGNADQEVAVSAPLSGLTDGVTYHFRLTAADASGTTNGSAGTFDAGAQHYQLTVSPTGSGSVSADQGAISNCTESSGTCSDSYLEDTVVTLSATPGAHKQVGAWGGACTGTPATDTSCEVTMSEAKAASVSFATIKRNVKANVTGNGSVAAKTGAISACTSSSGTCEGAYDENSSVTLVATPAANQKVVAWTGCTTTPKGPAGSECKLTVPANDAEVSVSFAPIMHKLSIAKAGSGGGTITCDGLACAAEYEQGTTISIAASPDGSSTFAGFSGGDCSSSPCSLTLSTDTSITATFDAKPASGGGASPAPAPAPSPTPTPKPLKCKAGFKKKKVKGKARCVKRHHHKRHGRHSHKRH